MHHFYIDPEKIIKVELTGVASILKPVVYVEGKNYCCLLGLDPESGIFGKGRTLEKALAEWDKSLQKHLAQDNDEDYIIAYVKNLLGKAQKSPSKNIQAFYDQFKMGK